MFTRDDARSGGLGAFTGNYPGPYRYFWAARTGAAQLVSDLAGYSDPKFLRKLLTSHPQETWFRIRKLGMRRFDGALTYVVRVKDAPYLVYVDAGSYVLRGVTGFSCGSAKDSCIVHQTRFGKGRGSSTIRHARFAWRMTFVSERSLPLCLVPHTARTQILRYEGHVHLC